MWQEGACPCETCQIFNPQGNHFLHSLANSAENSAENFTGNFDENPPENSTENYPFNFRCDGLSDTSCLMLLFPLFYNAVSVLNFATIPNIYD